VRVHGHEVIIAGTRAEVTPRHDFVIRVVGATGTRLEALSVGAGQFAPGPARYDRPGPDRTIATRLTVRTSGQTWR
jgi:hypothetical protein